MSSARTSRFHLAGFTCRVAVFAVVPRLAVIVAEVETATGTVWTLNVALLAPDEIVTVEGTVATEGLLLLSDTESPTLGAAPVSFTVPVELAPPTTVLGASESEFNAGDVTVSVADLIDPPLLAVIVTGVADATGIVETLNVAFVAPAGTVTFEGTTAAEELLDVRDTTTPPA
jgi:hypothetical protein